MEFHLHFSDHKSGPIGGINNHLKIASDSTSAQEILQRADLGSVMGTCSRLSIVRISGATDDSCDQLSRTACRFCRTTITAFMHPCAHVRSQTGSRCTPKAGISMLARPPTTILLVTSLAEAIKTTSIHRVACLTRGCRVLVTTRSTRRTTHSRMWG
jgi:hypothetical protein